MNKINTKIYIIEKKLPLLKILDIEESYFLYDAITNLLVRLDKEEIQKLLLFLKNKNLTSINKLKNTFDILFSDKRIDNITPIDNEYIKKLINYNMKFSLPRKFSVELTENCNFRCSYCHFTKNKINRSHTFKKIDFVTAQKAVDFYFDKYTMTLAKAPKKYWSNLKKFALPSISFWGGEPFIEFSLLVQIKNYFDNKNWIDFNITKDELHYSVVTNFSIINEEILEFIINEKFALFISLDGDEVSHNKNRKFINGKPTFKTVINNIDKLVTIAPEYAKKYVFINCVVAKNNSLNETVNFLYNHFDYQNNKKVNKISFYPEKMEAEVFPKISIKEDLTSDFKRQISAISSLDKINRKSIIIESRMLDYIEELNNKYGDIVLDKPNKNIFQNRTFSCPLGNDVLFVSVNGDIHACEKTDYSYPFGNVFSGISLEALHKFYKEYFAAINKQCVECWAFRFCNICPARVLYKKGFKLPDIQECDLEKKLHKENLENMIMLIQNPYLPQKIYKQYSQEEILSFSQPIFTSKKWLKNKFNS